MFFLKRESSEKDINGKKTGFESVNPLPCQILSLDLVKNLIFEDLIASLMQM
jgi:hypothetical protein